MSPVAFCDWAELCSLTIEGAECIRLTGVSRLCIHPVMVRQEGGTKNS